MPRPAVSGLLYYCCLHLPVSIGKHIAYILFRPTYKTRIQSLSSTRSTMFLDRDAGQNAPTPAASPMNTSTSTTGAYILLYLVIYRIPGRPCSTTLLLPYIVVGMLCYQKKHAFLNGERATTGTIIGSRGQIINHEEKHAKSKLEANGTLHWGLLCGTRDRSHFASKSASQPEWLSQPLSQAS